MEQLQVLQSFDNYVSAHIVKSRLEAEGILCALKDEQTVTMYWFWANALGGIKLMVPAGQLLQARHILDLIEKEATVAAGTPGFDMDDEDEAALDPANKICPHCGSRNTRKQDYNKVPAFLSILLLGFPLMFRSDKWHCFHCSSQF